LLPGDVDDAVVDAYPETLFLLNLYSPHFLYPAFYVTPSSIIRPGRNKDRYLHDQKQAHIFKQKQFVDYHQTLVTESGYGSWNALRMARGTREDWRLFVACLMYSGLTEYDNSKYPFIWQRESADMATILEALFTAGSDGNTEVGYKLRKRAATLIASRYPTIEQEIKTLYNDRSAFVHGSFFLNIAKKIQVVDGQLSIPPFDLLYGQKEIVRHVLIAYLDLNKIRRSTGEFEGFGTVMEILEDAIINLEFEKQGSATRRVYSVVVRCLTVSMDSMLFLLRVQRRFTPRITGIRENFTNPASLTSIRHNRQRYNNAIQEELSSGKLCQLRDMELRACTTRGRDANGCLSGIREQLPDNANARCTYNSADRMPKFEMHPTADEMRLDHPWAPGRTIDGNYNRLRAVVRMTTDQNFTPAAGFNQVRRMRGPYRKPCSDWQPIDPNAGFGFRFGVVIPKAMFHASILLK
jgi:hypothetical protein